MSANNHQYFGYTWKGIVQVTAGGVPMLFKTKDEAKRRNSARCKIVRVKLEVLP